MSTTQLRISFSAQHLKPTFTVLAPRFRLRLLDTGSGDTAKDCECGRAWFIHNANGRRPDRLSLREPGQSVRFGDDQQRANARAGDAHLVELDFDVIGEQAGWGGASK